METNGLKTFLLGGLLLFETMSLEKVAISPCTELKNASNRRIQANLLTKRRLTQVANFALRVAKKRGLLICLLPAPRKTTPLATRAQDAQKEHENRALHTCNLLCVACIACVVSDLRVPTSSLYTARYTRQRLQQLCAAVAFSVISDGDRRVTHADHVSDSKRFAARTILQGGLV